MGASQSMTETHICDDDRLSSMAHQTRTDSLSVCLSFLSNRCDANITYPLRSKGTPAIGPHGRCQQRHRDWIHEREENKEQAIGQRNHRPVHSVPPPTQTHPPRPTTTKKRRRWSECWACDHISKGERHSRNKTETVGTRRQFPPTCVPQLEGRAVDAIARVTQMQRIVNKLHREWHFVPFL